jgi:ATP-dependent exoDNAse (exonuclease V) alpha subunit
MEVQICTSTRTRGNISSYTLNRVIKNIYNPISDGEPFVKVSIEFDKCYYISKNDKVIITKNNYKASIWDSFTNDFVEGSIFNGSMGIVRSVEQGYIYIDIEDVGLVRLAFKDLDSVELGYAVTT